MRASHEDRQDLKTPEDILAKTSDAKLLERLFARIEPIYARRRRGLFNRLKATLLERTSVLDTELDKRPSDKWRMKNELRRAARCLEHENQARNPSHRVEGGARVRGRATNARARDRARLGHRAPLNERSDLGSSMPSTGTPFGDYLLFEELGRGGF